ncbi:MAG: FecR domain-containing protein [Prolixibacteraceae bacterium]
MKKEYLDFSLEELLEDQAFVAWVLRNENNNEWESFLATYQGFRNTAKKARGIIELLKDRHVDLGEQEIVALWKNIDRYDDLIKKRSNSSLFRSFQRYAALFILALSLGTITYIYLQKESKPYEFASAVSVGSTNKSRLSLANGTVVDLDKENSKVAMNGNQHVVIDNEKEIDLSQSNSADAAKMNEVIIPYGKKSNLILEDGTKVWLNAGSRMAFPTKFQGKTREVFLDGEAYFEVFRNEQLPFIVNTGDIAIRVLGTKFNLSAYQTDKLTETVLIEGKVSLSERSAMGYLKKETILNANQKASYNREEKAISVKEEPNADLAIAWIDGMFKFSQQSVQEVLNKLQQYYNVQFVFDSKFPSSDLISGKLDLKDSIEKTMQALADVAFLKYRIEGTKIYIEKIAKMSK